MSEVSRILNQLELGDQLVADQLLPLVYDELRRLAHHYLTREKPGQSLQATALVHEAFLRLVGTDEQVSFANRRHFFGAAAEAMRRILVEQARRKKSEKHGGGVKRQELNDIECPSTGHKDVEVISEALEQLAQRDPEAAELVRLRFFAGFTSSEAANILGVSPRTAERMWVYAKSFLSKEIDDRSIVDR